MWLLIDNYDSFTHILHHYLLQLHEEVMVFRNDRITIDELSAFSPERIIISPGPQTPEFAGITMSVIEYFHKTTPILGICLGHQALGQFFGATLVKSTRPFHGRTSVLVHNKSRLFDNLPDKYKVMRYHSLVITNWEKSSILPLAFTEDGDLMVMQIQGLPCLGIQFHPESILTEHGMALLNNWHTMCNENLW